MRILIIEDDTTLLQVLTRQFEAKDYIVHTAEDGGQGLHLATNEDYSVIILDNILPVLSGFDICKKLRSRGVTTPILMLSSCTNTDDKVDLLTVGADDYVTKPFFFREVHARIQALLRRPKSIQKTCIEIDDLRIDTIAGTVYRGEVHIPLTSREFSILELLAHNAGSVVSRASLLDHIWGSSLDDSSRVIETHIFNLRKKIDRHGPSLIKNASGRGYSLPPVNQHKVS